MFLQSLTIQYFINLGAALRKIAAILLLVILLFNWIGYRLFADFLQHRADVRLEAKLDKNDYSEDQLIEIKVPLNLPYQLNWSQFERFDGEIDVDGIHYKYVKRKIYNDSLVLLCLPNQTKQNIEKAKDDYYKIVNDIAPTSQKKSEKNNLSFKNILSEFFIEHPFLMKNNEACVKTNYVVIQTLLPASAVQESPGKPPEC